MKTAAFFKNLNFYRLIIGITLTLFTIPASAHGQEILPHLVGTLIAWISGLIIIIARKISMKSIGAAFGYILLTSLSAYLFRNTTSNYVFFGAIWATIVFYDLIFLTTIKRLQ